MARWRKLNIAVFIVMLACFAAIVTLFPRDMRTVERENRALNRFPALTAGTLLSGKFSADFGPYLSDRAGYRSTLVDVARAARNLRGFAPGGVRLSGSTLALPDRIMEVFAENHRLGQSYAEAIIPFREALPEGSRVFSVLVPTQIEFQERSLRAISDSERGAIDAVYNRLAEAGIVTVDAYSHIEAHTGEYVYFRTDHHWTALGAYYAYRAFAGAAGFVPLGISGFTERSAGDFFGYLYNREPVSGMEADTVYWYELPGLETSQPLFYPPGEAERATYGVFLGGDHAEYVIETNSGGGRTAIVVKDSYGNAFIPWLAPHYGRIIVIDPREYAGSVTALALTGENVDLIFVNYVFASTFADFISSISAVR